MGVLLNKIYDRYSAKDFLFLANNIKVALYDSLHQGLESRVEYLQKNTKLRSR